MWKCPKSEDHKQFDVTAHVTQAWIVDENNQFQKCTQECLEVTHKPGEDDVATCSVCGTEAEWVK